MPYFGRVKLYWCINCNVPVLGKKCGVCRGNTEKVEVTPPGDVRPALAGDIELINETIKKHFNCELIPSDKVAVLNKAPGYDRFDEVIIDGRVQGVLKFNAEKMDFEFLPRVEGARRIWKNKGKKFVEISESAGPYILNGASILLPGVVSFDEDILQGDEVYIVWKGNVIGVGRSRMSALEAKEKKKGMFVKVRRYSHPSEARELEGGQDWKTVLEANKYVVEAMEKEALEFIRRIAKRREPKVVAFSGGKDSLATLLLVKKVIPDVKVVFTNTGIEFPEIVEYAERIVERLGLEFIKIDCGDRFWEGVEYFGPPGRDYRWCCKLIKLGPIARLINEKFREGCISFIGQRKFESEVRSKSSRVWRNPWILSQLAASPVQNWTALHIWLYILMEGAEVNHLYEYGMERLGCWACPGSDLAEIEILKRIHPDLWRRWESVLKKSGLSEKAINHGFWRWRNPGKAQREVAGRVGVAVTRFEYGSDGRFDFERTVNFARVLGEVKFTKGGFEVNGHFFNGDNCNKVIKSIAERATHCFGCGVCLSQCKNNAIEIRDGKAWINDNCISCGRCHRRCPIVRYGLEVRDERSGGP